MYKHYVNYLKKFGYLPTSIEESLNHRIRISTIAKGRLLLNPGEICRQLIFVNNGYFRVFTNSEGLDKTVDITGPDSHLYITDSFLSQNLSSCGIECICDAEIMSLSFHEWKALMHYSNDYTQLIFKALLTEKDFYHKQLAITGKDIAKQRFLLIKSRYPQIDLSIKHHYIADLLNISTIHLSRIKKEVLLDR